MSVKTEHDDYVAAWPKAAAPAGDEFEREMARHPPTSAERLADGGGVGKWWDELRNVAGEADATAEREFPDEARDASRKNAFRHALGTGRLAQLLGADSGVPVVREAAAGAAKLAGYAWEGLSAAMGHGDATDRRHDLNANAIGAAEAKRTSGREALVERLRERAGSARREDPPGLTEKSPGYLTYTK